MFNHRQFECNEGCNSWDLIVRDNPVKAGGGVPELLNQTTELGKEASKRIKELEAERDRYKKLWDKVKEDIRLDPKDKICCTTHCLYLYRNKKCMIFNKHLQKIDAFTFKRCKDCLEIFEGE